MIFVTVGTSGFDDLVRMMDILTTSLEEEVIIQTGKGNYVPRNCEHFSFTENLNGYFKKARLVVTHGGAGTLLTLSEMQKKTITVINESVVHNPDIVLKLSSNKHIIWCKKLKDLGKTIKNISEFELKKYKKESCTIGNEINKFIGEMNELKRKD